MIPEISIVWRSSIVIFWVDGKPRAPGGKSSISLIFIFFSSRFNSYQQALLRYGGGSMFLRVEAE